MDETTLDAIVAGIAELKAAANGLEALGDEIPALNRNLARITASIKMLEINFVDPAVE